MHINLFWSEPLKDQDSLQDWLSTDITTSYFHELSMASYKKYKHPEHEISLYTYQNIVNEIPDCITIKDASQYYPAEKAYEALSKGHSIAHISDLVRFRASLENDGLILDMDAVIVNPLPEDVKVFNSTMPAKSTGGMAIKWGKSHPPFIIHDGTWDGKALSVFPVKVHKDMFNEYNALADHIESTLSKEPGSSSKDWNYVMWEMKRIANENPEVKVYPPIKNCVVPGWKSKGNCYTLESPTPFDGSTSKFGFVFPHYDEVLKEAYIIQHFFESAFKNSSLKGESFWSDIKPGSLVHMEADRIFGKNWKQKYINDFDEW
jgi:hypothetical protein